MNKRLILWMLLLLALGGCKTISSGQYNTLQNEARHAADLAAENSKLKAQNKKATALNNVLKQEVNDQQVIIEMLSSNRIQMTLQNAILFSPGQFELNKNGRRILDIIAPMLNTLDDEQLVRIVGHTDNLPVHAAQQAFVDNWDLSARRAASVVRYLIWAHKLPADMFRIEGHADVEPEASNDTDEGRAKNRRIEMFIEH